MNALTRGHFDQWLEAYGKASQENDPEASADLFADDAHYCETPFEKPMIGREAIYQYWSQGAQNLKDKESAYEILAVQANTGIARWQAQFTVIRTGQRIALDCIFLAEFDSSGKCKVFREWWHSQRLNAG